MKQDESSRGFILIFSLIMVMGVSSLAIGMIYNAHAGKITALNYKNKIQGFFASDGMVTLLAQEMIEGRSKVYLDESLTGKISGDVWEGVLGTSIQAFKYHIASNPHPSRVAESGYLGGGFPIENYGVRWKGFFSPPISGTYTFYVRSTGGSAFHLSSNESRFNLSSAPIAYLDTKAVAWPSTGTGVSKPRFLEGGKQYYFEYLHKHGLGIAYGQVGWKGPEFLVEKPMPGKRLSSSFHENLHSYDTTRIGHIPMATRYRVTSLNPNVYNLSCDSHKLPWGDSSFHLPLNQVLDLTGKKAAPPDTHWARVIYYDFLSNGTNPEFQFPLPFPYEVHSGMVKSRVTEFESTNADYFGLDSIPKPSVSSNPKYNCMVGKWFRPWAAGDFTIPSYAAGRHDCTPVPAADDRTFRNAVIKDSLPFLRRPDLGTNVYRYSRIEPDGVAGFFPIDNRGFGNDNVARFGIRHNFNFCLEMHSEFEYYSGMNLEFVGDDDLWVFINDSLVMDLGYIHNQTSGTLNLDDLTHLEFGEIYRFDLFFCERQATGSWARFTTNIPLRVDKRNPRPNWSRNYGSLD